MAVAAFIVSIVAVLLAGLSALYTKKQADAAAAMSVRDAERRHEERHPRFSARVDVVNEGDAHWYRLVLRLLSHEALSHVRVEITENSGVMFSGGQDGVDVGKFPPTKAEKGGSLKRPALAADAPALWRLLLADQRSEMRLKIHAEINGDEWDSVEVVDVPVEPQVW